MMALPNETLTAIFNELPPPSLAVLACVSFRFNAVAERMLYSSVFLTDLISETSPAPQRTLWWCEAMRRRTHLFDTTRKLCIKWQADESAPPPHYQYLLTACERLAEVLPALVSLELLDLFLGPSNLIPPHELQRLLNQMQPYTSTHIPGPIHAVERVLRNCRFAHLRSCSLGAEWVKGVQSYTTVLPAFLSSLPSLRHLRFSDLHATSAMEILDSTRLPHYALPFLSSFRGSANAAAAILPGRPVQYLSLMGRDSDVNQENLLKMTWTTVPLKYLDLSAISARPILLTHVSTHFSMVQTLRIRLALRHTLHYALTGIRLLSTLSQFLNAFPQLSYLDLSPTGIDGVGRPDPHEELDLCKVWHRACPSLKRIIFPSQTEWLLDAEEDVWNLVRNNVEQQQQQHQPGSPSRF
jgi:hypothetical protein